MERSRRESEEVKKFVVYSETKQKLHTGTSSLGGVTCLQTAGLLLLAAGVVLMVRRKLFK